MILKGEKWNIDLSNSYLIGDRFKDIDAGEKLIAKLYLWIMIIMNVNQLKVPIDLKILEL